MARADAQARTARIHSTLDNMRGIVEREMLIHGHYADPVLSRPDLADAGAICAGHKYCAIGTMFVSYGVRAFQGPPSSMWRTDEWNRMMDAYDQKSLHEAEPVLGEILEALNASAVAYCEAHVREGWEDDPAVPVDPALAEGWINGWNLRSFRSNIEAFFENNDPGRDVLLEVINGAEALLLPPKRRWWQRSPS